MSHGLGDKRCRSLFGYRTGSPISFKFLNCKRKPMF
jgi:hypothetical protein